MRKALRSGELHPAFGRPFRETRGALVLELDECGMAGADQRDGTVLRPRLPQGAGEPVLRHGDADAIIGGDDLLRLTKLEGELERRDGFRCSTEIDEAVACRLQDAADIAMRGTEQLGSH